MVETDAAFAPWFRGRVRRTTVRREEQAAQVVFALVPDLDLAGARGAAMVALDALASR